MNKKLTHGSLFSGIGGFDLAAHWMDWENVFHCEINPFALKILKYYFPKATSYEDIKKTDFRKYRGLLDILTGGFPCQPFSLAGSRKGSEDDRYLWPEMLRAIREIRPTWVVGENVAGITTMVQSGQITEMETQASLFEEDNTIIKYEQDYILEGICRDLEQEGYSVQPLIIPACSVGAPHKRDRIWFLAHSNHGQCIEQDEELQARWDSIVGGSSEFPTHSEEQQSSRNKSEQREVSESEQRQSGRGCSQNYHFTSNPNGFGLRNESNGKGESGFVSKESKGDYWENFPTQSPICTGDDGIPSRLDGITFSKWRNNSIQGAGNAIVPQLAYEIFTLIQQIENNGKESN